MINHELKVLEYRCLNKIPLENAKSVHAAIILDEGLNTAFQYTISIVNELKPVVYIKTSLLIPFKLGLMSNSDKEGFIRILSEATVKLFKAYLLNDFGEVFDVGVLTRVQLDTLVSSHRLN